MKIIISPDWTGAAPSNAAWSARTEDYDGPGSPIGFGATQRDAVLDLAEQIAIADGDYPDGWPIEIAAKVCPVFRAITGG